VHLIVCIFQLKLCKSQDFTIKDAYDHNFLLLLHIAAHDIDTHVSFLPSASLSLVECSLAFIHVSLKIILTFGCKNEQMQKPGFHVNVKCIRRLNWLN